MLVRPLLKEARSISELRYKFEVFEHDIKGASGIWTEGCGSGQGTTVCDKTALYLDGWDPVILHETWYGNNMGTCGEYSDRPCHSKHVEWTFMDLNGDGRADLVELVIEQSGPLTNHLTWKTKTNVYLSKGDRFVSAPEPDAPRPSK